MSARFWAVIIGPIGPAPCATWGREHDEVEVTGLHAREAEVLGVPVEEIVLGPADQHTNLEDC